LRNCAESQATRSLSGAERHFSIPVQTTGAP
jgi:hypothetical protein